MTCFKENIPQTQSDCPFFLCSLTRRFKEGDNGDRSCQGIRTCPDHLLPCFPPSAPWPSYRTAVEMLGPSQPSIKREGFGLLASESPPPLNYDPRPSPPINLAQERVALSSRREKGGMESDCWSSTLDSTFINHVT